ncbi:leucine-rich repeat domain-containing protein [Stratiformator vulcanicus]|uniref:Leucine Rich repeats (2 copies) n=1 Tax=Stratiformator vulcanicus TaxID=2527980 RepID=A0A517R3F8_9PLAN|nr:hypothetical protein [Stratiformator vulcanicus]QDT38363.1 Leucine Rich repeats (2 copies) [Stratiformator vulcanicus]
MTKQLHVSLLWLGMVLTVAQHAYAQNANPSRAEQLRSLGAENIREIDGELSYVNLKDSRFSDDSAFLIEDQQSIVFLSVARTSSTDKTLSTICGLNILKWLFLDGTKITDEAAVKLQDLKNLRTLSVSGTAVTDKTFAKCSWKTIHTLVVSDTEITDATVKSLSKLTTLHHLDLSGTSITDDCIDSLIAIKSLTHLDLSDTKITDAGFAKLMVLSELRELEVAGTEVTIAAIAAFNAKRPNCLIHGPKAKDDNVTRTLPQKPRNLQ